MTDYVIDASAAVEYLLRTETGARVAGIIEGAGLVAPEMIDAEVLSSLRKAVLRGRLEEARARMAVDSLMAWNIERVAHRGLARLAWQHYQNVGAYDAFYVAVARVRGVPLLTVDGRLARAPGLGIVVEQVVSVP